MNLPNKLTVLRVIMVPFFVFFMLTDVGGAANKWIALAIFVIASLTDMLDGKIARKYNLVTNFGKFMDPLADKMLVSSAFICLVAQNKIAAWIVIVIIAREFVISGFRLVASDSGVVIAASYWGKFKTNFQMFAIILLMLNLGENFPAYAGGIHIAEQILIYIALILTIVSLVDYLAKNIDVLKEGGNEK
jgi:CDP-diacylglycerol--glycerol-3-phosphate 3-phosphatidyltransferase